MTGQFTATDDPRRIEAGLVFIDNELANGPATHVLIAGVAAYQSEEFPELLKTATTSARKVADWFLDAAGGFQNEYCGLGSLALLLSEAPGDDLAQYKQGPVPRVGTERTKKSLKSWVDRINTSPDNIGIIYVVGHGFSDYGKTAVLLEDYGKGEHDATHGMAEAEQLVGALENAVPDSILLLFDCCRSQDSSGLQPGETLGKLISLRARARAAPPNIWAICSTALGKSAYGLQDGPTFFCSALLDALNGVASETTLPRRPVRAALMSERLDQLLNLHRRPGSRYQVPSGRGTGSFSVNYPVRTGKQPVYISLCDPANWPNVTINVSDTENRIIETIMGQGGVSPYAKCMLPDGAEIHVKATLNGELIGEVTHEVMPPALFLEIGAASMGRAPAPTHTTRSVGTRSVLELQLSGKAGFIASAVAEIAALDGENFAHPPVVLSAGKTTELPGLSPGRYGIRVQMPDGQIQTQTIALDEGNIVTASFATLGSQDDWTSWPSPPNAANIPSAEPEADARTVGFLGLDRSIEGSVSDAALTRGAVNGSQERWDVADKRDQRFAADDPARGRPIFACVSTGERREFAVLPSLGQGGDKVRGRWLPHLIVDRRAPTDQRTTTVAIQTAKWGSLLGFLACRDFASGSILLREERIAHSARVALEDVNPNPLPALAGALIAVAAAREVDTWVPLVHQIMETYSGVPDAPIILARHKLMFAKSADSINDAKPRLLAACQMGVPYFSLSAEWLARGLEGFDESDSEVMKWQKIARQLASRVDPTTAFTIVRAS